MFVAIVPESLKLGEKLGEAFEAEIVKSATAILKRLVPQATVVTPKTSDHWTRLTLDTPETFKAPKTEKSTGKANRMGDVVKAGYSIDTLYTRIVALKGTKAADGHVIDGQEAIKLAGAEQKMPDVLLYSFGLVRKVEAAVTAKAKAKAATATAAAKK
jgi:hypothetical protein